MLDITSWSLGEAIGELAGLSSKGGLFPIYLGVWARLWDTVALGEAARVMRITMCLCIA